MDINTRKELVKIALFCAQELEVIMQELDLGITGLPTTYLRGEAYRLGINPNNLGIQSQVQQRFNK